ncbi:hypothetical protein HDE_07804 [Halotydeus destructor]|nr:hypothetical protein HDE_07804 [Halotydeus destructor]
MAGLVGQMDNFSGPVEGSLFNGARKRNPSLKVLIGFGGHLFITMLDQPDKRKRVISSARNHVSRYGYQGIFVAWQPAAQLMSPANESSSHGMSSFLVEVRREFGLNFTIGLEGPENGGGNWLSEQFCNTVDKTVDLVDMNTRGPSSYLLMTPAPLYPEPPSFFSQVTPINLTVSKWLACGVTPSKLLMRVSSVAASYTVGSGATYPTLAIRHHMCNSVSGHTFHPSWALTVANNGSQVFVFEDEASLLVKVKYATEYGLAGMTVFQVPYDDARGDCGQGVYPILNLVSVLAHEARLNGTLRDQQLRLAKQEGHVTLIIYLIGGLITSLCVAISIVVTYRYCKHKDNSGEGYDEVYYTTRSYVEVIEPADH